MSNEQKEENEKGGQRKSNKNQKRKGEGKIVYTKVRVQYKIWEKKQKKNKKDRLCERKNNKNNDRGQSADHLNRVKCFSALLVSPFGYCSDID